jgi:DNA transformation protein
VSESYRTFILDQLGRALPDIRTRNMFGAVGIYSENLFFAVIADDSLYLKSDAGTRARYEAHGMQPFRPYGEQGEAMQYYQIAAGILEDPAELAEWAALAVDAARRKKVRGRKKKG